MLAVTIAEIARGVLNVATVKRYSMEFGFDILTSIPIQVKVKSVDSLDRCAVLFLVGGVVLLGSVFSVGIASKHDVLNE